MAVMILGANGTGKESVAQSIHQGSERWNKPFVAVNCGALPRELAARFSSDMRKGRLPVPIPPRQVTSTWPKAEHCFWMKSEQCPLKFQSMLLRVLQESSYMPIGSSKERVADVRIVSATNEDLQQAIKEGRFREDLYHRLNEFEIRQPSLSECPEDILPLAEFFRERFSRELKRETSDFSDDARSRMLAYPWPGNVRELQNRVKRSVLVSESPVLEMEGLDTEIHQHDNESTATPAIRPLKDETQEKMNIINALKACNGHREQAAAMLKINPATLYRKMKKYGLN